MDILGWLGWAVAVALGILRLFEYRRDRAHLQFVVGQALGLKGKPLLVCRLTNSGRRPVTVVALGAQLHYGETWWFTRLGGRGVGAVGKVRLDEGDDYSELLPASVLPEYDQVKYFFARDNLGRTYKAKKPPGFPPKEEED